MKWSRYLTTEPLGDAVYIHAGLSGSFNRIPVALRERADAFCAGTDDGTGIEDELEAMVRARILVGDDVDELAELEQRYERSRHRGGLGLTIVTSLGCNFDCPYCFESKRPSLLKPDVEQALIGLVDDGLAAGTPSMHVMWMGGEPLLGADHLLRLSDAFIERCDRADTPYTASITTNGWYLDEAMAKRLAAVRVRAAQVTIDGPAEVHDHYRPTVSGRSSYRRLVENVAAASRHLTLNVRVNIDNDNFARVDELLADLAASGAADRIRLTPARLTTIASSPDAPARTYQAGCYSCSEFATVETEFDELARRHGLRTRDLPGRVGSPCTAVRSTELVVGSDGELWKCWDDVGNPDQAIGTIFSYTEANDKLAPWLAYSPFDDEQCRSCIALPGCMGGCAHHSLHGEREDQCMSFRFNHRERVRAEAHRAVGAPIPPTGLALYRASIDSSPFATHDVPVTIGPRPSPLGV